MKVSLFPFSGIHLGLPENKGCPFVKQKVTVTCTEKLRLHWLETSPHLDILLEEIFRKIETIEKKKSHNDVRRKKLCLRKNKESLVGAIMPFLDLYIIGCISPLN